MAARKTASKPAAGRKNQLASRLEKAAGAAVEIFRQQQAPFALIGGLALGLRTAPRATQDIDFAVAVTDDQAEKVVHALQAVGFRVAAVLVNKRDQSLATVRVEDGQSGILVDLLISFCGIEHEIVADATTERWASLVLPVASSSHLVAMKLLANRKQDQADLESLLRTISARERATAVRAVTKMMSAGLGEGRDLVAELKALFGASKPSSPFEPSKRRF